MILNSLKPEKKKIFQNQLEGSKEILQAAEQILEW